MVDYIPTIGAGMLSGYLHFRHFAYPVPAADQIPPAVVTMPRGFNRVNGTVPPETGSTGWWNDGTIRLASVDGFASIAGLLSLAEPPPADEPYPLPVDENGDVMGIPTQQYEDDWHNKNVYNWDLDPTQIPEDLDATDFTAYSPSTATQATLEEEKIYFVDQCSQGGTGTLLLTGTIRNVTIVTNCKIDIAGSARIENAVLLTTAGNVKNGETSGITISNGAKIGAPTQCENWGGVRMYSAGDIYANGTGSNPDSADQSQFWGAQLVARNRIHFAAKSDSEKGISLLAGGDIDIAAQAEIGALTVTTPYPVAGCPEYGVKPEVDSSVYQPALVQ